jgi:hypothetical protein
MPLRDKQVGGQRLGVWPDLLDGRTVIGWRGRVQLSCTNLPWGLASFSKVSTAERSARGVGSSDAPVSGGISSKSAIVSLFGNREAECGVTFVAIKKMSDSPGWMSGNRVPTRCLPVKIGCLSTDKRKCGFKPGATMFHDSINWAASALEHGACHCDAIERSET